MSGHPGTPGQTVGPFFHYALPYPGGNELVPHGTGVRLHGVVRDGAGDPVPDALLEIWQPDAEGRIVAEPGSLSRDGYTFTGWGRAQTDAAGHYWLTTLRPGPTRAGQAPFFAVTVFARGLLHRLHTRAYLPDDDIALAADPLLAALPPARRATLVTAREPRGFRFDVALQGAAETVFLEHP